MNDFCRKEEAATTTVALANDVQVLAKECSGLRSSLAQTTAALATKLDALRDATDRQDKMDRTQLAQRLDALADQLATHEIRTREAIASLLKNHARVRTALDDGLTMCSRDTRTLASEGKAWHSEQSVRMEEYLQQLTDQRIDCAKKHDALHGSLQSLAQAVNVSSAVLS